MDPCKLCGTFTEDVWWGDTMGAARAEPPEFRRMEVLPGNVYRCPECGVYHDLKRNDTSFLNADYTQYSLERFAAEGEDMIRARSYDSVRRQDFSALNEFLQSAGPADQVVILKTLEAFVVEKNLDIGSLEPMLRNLFAGPPDVQAPGARLLSCHFLRHGRHAEVLSLLQLDSRGVQRGTLEAVWHGATGSWPAGVRPCLQAVRSFLADEEENIRGNARAILVTAGLQADEAANTIADATRRLDSPRPEERSAAASILAEAAERGVGDIRPALPRLQDLMREKAKGYADHWAQKAIAAAARRGISIPDVLPDLVERLRRSHDLEIIHTLRVLQERGEDISPAFGALAEMAGSWPLELLVRAAMNGDDLSSAEASLRKLVEEALMKRDDLMASYYGRLAIGILARHYFFRGRWKELAALLGNRTELVRTAVSEMINQSGRLWDVVAPWKEGQGNPARRKAASTLACLLFFDDRSERLWHLLDSPSPDVVSGALEGLLKAAKGGLNVEAFVGRLQTMQGNELAAEIVRAAKPHPVAPPAHTEWHSKEDHCELRENEVVCWSGYGHNEVGAGCSLQAFLEGDRLQMTVKELFGQDVFNEVFAAVKARCEQSKPAEQQKPVGRQKPRTRRKKK